VSLRNLARASLLLNLVLLGVVAYQSQRQAAPLPGPTASPSARVQPAPTEATSVAKQDEAPREPGPRIEESRGDWRRIESSDYPTYIANLRAIGCPEPTIRDIIGADLNNRSQARKTALYLEAKGPFTFWATDDHTHLEPARAAELTEKLALCDREQSTAWTQLFGAEPGDGRGTWTEQQAERERRLAFLPPATQNQLRALDALDPDLDEQIQAVVDVRSSITNPQELQQLLDRYSRRKTELSQVLSPQEFEQYELNTSWTAENVRRRLAGFEPTEDEFRTIFQLWRAHDDALATVYALHQPEPGNLDVFSAIEQYLGKERYAQYRQAWGGQPVPPATENPPPPGDAPSPR